MLYGYWMNKLHNEQFVHEIYFLKQLLTHTKSWWVMIRQDSIENSDIVYMRQYEKYIFLNDVSTWNCFLNGT